MLPFTRLPSCRIYECHVWVQWADERSDPATMTFLEKGVRVPVENIPYVQKALHILR